MGKLNDYYKPVEFDSIRIGICSPDKILRESHGEVKKPETINYRTLKPEPEGLYCERIFGPNKDWECYCGKYKKVRYKGVICDKCGVEITKSSVRRHRIGHINLAAPVSHIWYYKSTPSPIATLLGISQKDLEKVIYFTAYIVMDPGDAEKSISSDIEPLKKYEVISEATYRRYSDTFGKENFRVGMGAGAVRELLAELDLEEEYKALKAEIDSDSCKGQRKLKLVKRIEIVDAFRTSKNKPEWMIITVLPVLPPDLRPMVQLDGGRFATSDLNDLYRRIINRNNRLIKLNEMKTPEIITRNEKRMLQEAVDALIGKGADSNKKERRSGNKELKSLSDMLKGKQGRFRQNLLGKRVDFSGRSVIVVGPELKIDQCGLPKEMAIELFKPFVMRELVAKELAKNIQDAKKKVEKQQDQKVWDVLDEVIKEHPVLLNRAPTLHRLGIQAFEPILVEGKAIKLHPLVCTAFNADFDGDQMAVHVPLSLEAQAESRFLMLSTNNLLKPSDGGVVAVPSQDMVLGIYYLTQDRPNKDGLVRAYRSEDEARLAYENKIITLHEKIKVRVNSKLNRTDEKGRIVTGIVETTMGKLIFNEIIPQDLGFVDRTDPNNEFIPEINYLVKKGNLKKILEKIMETHGVPGIAKALDDIKSMGYKYSTIAAITVSIADITVPETKKELIQKAEETIETIRKNYSRGLITDEERYKETIDTWKKTDEQIATDLMNGLDKYNNIYMMADSGARGSGQQIKQLAGMRGLMADTTGHTIELPIKSNFREGLDVLEYFISAHGARKGLSDTALRTADSGYLTRRLVDVAHDLVIREDDCCADGSAVPYMEVRAFKDGNEMIENLRERIVGRFIAETVIDGHTGEKIIETNQMITPKIADKIMAELEKQGRDSLKIRTVLTCKSKTGICAHCYGANLATGEKIGLGETVGVIAAQSIGEPGTQLTMRTFHTGGVAGGDITQGLPRVEELFEARNPKGMAIVSDISGKVSIIDAGNRREVKVKDDETGDEKKYFIPFGLVIKVKENQVIKAGDPITEGSINPNDILKIKDVRSVQDYLLKEVQRVYRLQGVDINDKHIETIVKQMLRMKRVLEKGDSEFLPNTLVEATEFDYVRNRLIEEGKMPPIAEQVLRGIAKSALERDSFLSAASFQETPKVLTESSIRGKIDKLRGLKENVIIGRLIPAGTGMSLYQNTKISSDDENISLDEEESFVFNQSQVDYEGKQNKVNDQDDDT